MSDADGYTSGAFTYMELKHLNPNLDIKYILHKGKEHGIVLEELKNINYDFDLLVVPDGGSNDKQQIEVLNKQNKQVLILDHHLYNETLSNNAIRINCQDGQYSNTEISGVGVCYKFFHLYEELNNLEHYSDTMLDLVAIGNIGDMMDLRSLETRYLCQKGLDLFNEGKGNKFIRALVQHQEKRIGDTLNFIKVAFNISPYINAVVREGKQEEKEDVFKALIESNETRTYQPRRKHKDDPKPDPIEQDLQTYMARVISNVKARQDKIVKKQFDKLNEKIKENGLDNYSNKILLIDGTEDIDKTYTGYVANKIANYYKRPTLLYRRKTANGLDFGGSGRNYDKFGLESLMDLLKDSGCFNYAQGHDNAFGLGFSLEGQSIKDIQSKLNEMLSDHNIEDIYSVDYAIPVGKLRPKHISQVGQFDNIWGGTLKEPLFAITDVYISPSDVQLLGAKQNVLKITKTIGGNQIVFIQPMKGKEFYDKILGKTKGITKKTSSKIGLDIIGKFQINKWEGNEYPQILIVDLNVLDKKEILF